MEMYVVVENGDPYPNIYTSFLSAAKAAQDKYKEVIEEQMIEADGYPICSELDVPEHTSGTTYLYVEKGIHIYIYKLKVLSD
jgi:hypothetical protein